MIQPTLLQAPRKPRVINPKEYRLQVLREVVMPSEQQLCDTPALAANYWRTAIATSPMFNGEVESFWVLIMNTRRRIIGHHLVATGTLDTILVHPREVFRVAIVANAAALIVMHNHPSGDPTPSEADIKVTRDLIRAGTLIKIDLIDHVVMGIPDCAGNASGYASLRELGYFYS